jgi:predicted ATPase
MVSPDFSLTNDNARDVAAICGLLDGLPLAIEIAASRVRLFPPAALLRRLDDSIGLYGDETDRPKRQQTLRETIAWSEALLTPSQRDVFRRLGVFAGGCDLDAFAKVAVDDIVSSKDGDPLDILESLMDLSLVRLFSTPDREQRLGLLATIRQYARKRLTEANELEEFQRKHAEYYLQLAERISQRLRGADHLAMLDRLEAEHDNFGAALDWALEPNADEKSPDAARATIGLRLVVALSWFWYGHGHAAMGRRWLELAIDATSDDAPVDLSQALHGLGVLLLQQGELEAGQTVLERSLALSREMGDSRRVAQELSSLGVARRDRGDLNAARQLLEESVALARDLDDPRRLATALSNLATVEIDSGAAERAISILREASAIDGEIGDTWGFVVDQTNLAMALLRTGLTRQAWNALASVVDHALQLADLDLTICIIEGFAATCAVLGLPLVAATLAGASDELRKSGGIPQSGPDAGLLERYLGPARADSTIDNWKRSFEAGRGLSQDDAVAFVLKEAGRALNDTSD